MDYYFGVYHWRRRFRRLAVALALLVAGVAVALQPRLLARLGGVALLGMAVRVGQSPVRSLTSPPPWRPDAWKYRELREALPYAEASRVLDAGCGTGRSLVGLAPGIPDGCRVLGLDVFDDRVILGNGPALARRNASQAGLDCDVVAGDAARLPVADDTQGVVTACRLLHDLPRDAATSALAEARRVLEPGGTLGVLELPIPHEEDADPLDYWVGLVGDAGFAVDKAREVERGGYFLVVATPESG